ncbi:MAG: hypothetical protein ACK5Q5_13025 [Planctomycetaceae bacterium]
MSRRVLIVLTLLTSVASLLLLWTDWLPLGVPGEWTWARLSYSTPGLLWSGLICTAAAAAYGTFAWLGDRRMATASRGEAMLWLLALVAAGFSWLWAVQSASIEGVGLSKSPYVLYYRRTEGYYWQARYDVTSVAEFLVGYEQLLAERDYLHIGTHPPGLTLLYCGLINSCERWPGLVRLAETTMPADMRQTLEMMEQQVQSGGTEFTQRDSACLWLATLATQLAAALVVIPMYRYLRLSSERAAVWRTVVLWPLVPSVAIFLPKSDVLYPVLGLTAGWMFRAAWYRSRERLTLMTVVCAVLGGLVVVGGMVLSLAFLSVLALIGMQWLCDVLAERRDDRQRTERVAHELTIAACLLGCFLIALGGVMTAFGYRELNLLNVWQWNLSNHALFYEHNARTYWKWLLINPLEITLAAGTPIVALVKWGAWRQLRNWRDYLSSPVVPFTVVWMLLWLSGKNMGEASRLWILILPWLVAAAINAFAAANSTGQPTAPPASRRLWLAFLVLQMIVSSATLLRVDGFHFTELLKP